MMSESPNTVVGRHLCKSMVRCHLVMVWGSIFCSARDKPVPYIVAIFGHFWGAVLHRANIFFRRHGIKPCPTSKEVAHQFIGVESFADLPTCPSHDLSVFPGGSSLTLQKADFVRGKSVQKVSQVYSGFGGKGLAPLACGRLGCRNSRHHLLQF